MNKTLLGILVTAVAVVAIGGVFVLNDRDDGQTAGTASGANGSQQTVHDSEMPAPPAGSFGRSEGDSGQVTETDKVAIQNFAFSPAKIRVKKGTTVTWTNQDSARHDITPDQPSDAFKASELLAQGESYSFTFNTVGTYSYYCSPHPYMKASVEVVE